MNPLAEQSNNSYILYDPELFGKIDDSWFETNHWKQRQAIIGNGKGRGAAWFVSQGEAEMVLRHYIRGGLIRSLSRDRYVWTGLEQTRAWREWKLLATMKQLDLPVPYPVAARVQRHGLFYTGDLLTQRIQGAESLTNRLVRDEVGQELWEAIGACIHRFHAAGIYHADLNAHNILLDTDNKVYLIDFDKCEQRSPGSWRTNNLKRLQRSFRKLSAIGGSFYYKDEDWGFLMQGYGK